MRTQILATAAANGELEKFRDLIIKTAGELPPIVESEGAKAARERIVVIHALTSIGDTARAEKVARSFPGPAWRAFGLSVIVGTATRSWASKRWGGPSLDPSLDSPSA